jgi:hypothetical protein
VAVIVNAMSEINIDPALLRRGHAAIDRVEERLVEMTTAVSAARCATTSCYWRGREG